MTRTASRHSDVLALYGLWIGFGLVAKSSVPRFVLGFGSGQTVAAGMYVLTGVVLAGQGAILCRAPGRYVDRHLTPAPIERIPLANRADVYVVGAVTLVLGTLFIYLGLALLRAVMQLPA